MAITTAMCGSNGHTWGRPELVLFPHRFSRHTIQIILFVFYIHVSFTSLTLLAYSAQRFSQNARIHVQQV